MQLQQSSKQVEQPATLLNGEKYEDALNQLKSADKRLEGAISADISVKLIPVVQDVRTYDLVTSPQAVQEEVDVIGGELKHGNVQEARLRFDRLRIELVTSYVYLPVEIYPAQARRRRRQSRQSSFHRQRKPLSLRWTLWCRSLR